MVAVGTIGVQEDLSENQRVALLKLLGDEDPAVYQAIREKILACGPGALTWLRPHVLSNDPALRRRAQEIVRRFEQQAADNDFVRFCLQHGEEFELEQGAFLLARTQFPEINVEAYQALLDSYAEELRERVDLTAPARKLLAEINQYLFRELGFAGNQEDYYEADNSYLNRVIDRRKGNPVNLCLVYILIARRLRLPIAGIGLPGHFVCRYQSSAAELYIDAFDQGKLLAKADCVQYLLRGNFSIRDDYLAPLSPRRLLLRICGNLHQIYSRRQLEEETTRLQRYLVALSR